VTARVCEHCAALEARVAAMEATLARVAAAFGLEAPPYTTRKAGPRPDGWALRSWQKVAPSIPGAIRHGRYWKVAREAFNAWEKGAARSTLSTTEAPPANDAEPWTAAKALARAGLKATR
jgi:hypothetical protein